ncbi:hypothetical protein SAMN05421788_105327 [Filimonas lacunae]|uniref:Lysylphosphatidylglycerol synthase TM region n=1 Tax=Filimonas lacunae TaxID=477680 RepID=A0A173MCG3_9BACT|nr:lysylphosphatidylglycerol synthase transmembrane domain-containing protein [Filimonas lacunae]BAV05217.1 dolichol-P-glucose synthetase [Filimonas lacunae]SIT22579.1 hypothetical protein SAMN05421788_105327 [Filimonas lacunae]
MKRITLYIIKYLVGFGIALFFVWWSVHSLTAADTADIKAALLKARFWLLLPVFAVLIASHWFRARRWKQLIQPLGYTPTTAQLLCGLLIGYIANQLIPRAGEIIRCTSVAKAAQIPTEKLIGTLVAERAFDILCLAIITTATVLLEYQHMETYFIELYNRAGHSIVNGGNGRWWWLLGIAIVILSLVWVWRRVKHHHKTAHLVKSVMKGLAEGLRSIQRLENKPLFLLNTLLIWTCYIFSTWIGCWALQETAHLPVTTALAMLIFGSLGIMVTPGGLGAYPIIIQKTLSFYGLSENIGRASGWILWTAQFIFTMVTGTIAWIMIHHLKQRMNEKRSTHPA